MKVYVDELYSSCSSCPFFSDELLNCFASDDKELVLKFSKDFNRIYQRHPECPLQSLTDYTKQVRKEVCEEFVDKFMMEYTMGDKPVEDIIYEVKSQIQGEDINA